MRKFLAILIPVIAAAGCASEDPVLVAENFRMNIAGAMSEAAKQAGVELFPTEVAITTRAEYVVANAPLAAPDGVLLQERKKISLLYLSFPSSHPCAAVLPAGFYTLERTAIPYADTTTAPDSQQQSEPYREERVDDTVDRQTAKLVDSTGRDVIEFPLYVKSYQGEPMPDATGPMIYAEASIKNRRSSVVVGNHGVICYPDGTYYWTWSEPGDPPI